jgi:multicomponent Na+:H+ antiporter subunit E
LRFLATTAVMFAFWLLLSGYLDGFHIVTGLISSMLVAYLSADLLFPGTTPFGTRAVRMARFAAYLPWLFYKIVTANFDVAYRVLHPRMPIDPRIIRFKTDLKDDMAIASLANSITLTPGTVTIEASKNGEFVVHAISKEAADELLTGEMAKRITHIADAGRKDV